ncbi:MAG: hypothetical protein HGA75_02635 [Thiobacillus sp.]|nr:hypothetical protein [Thiobacillus sp.]
MIKRRFATALVVLLVLCSFNGCGAANKVISLTRSVDESDYMSKICTSFVLERSDVLKYFKYATVVGRDEYNDKAIVLPCKYVGEMWWDGRKVNWKIYAGGAGAIYADGVDALYICKDACCSRFKNLC